MGLFLQNVILLDCDEKTAKAALKKAEQISDSSMLELVPEECQFQQFPKGVSILLNDHFWGYCFYDKGEVLDVFTPLPDYFETASEKDRRESSGNSGIIASYFDIEEDSIKNYLVSWEDLIMEDDFEARAYADDECGQCDCWQMVDFMRKLGFPYEWDN